MAGRSCRSLRPPSCPCTAAPRPGWLACLTDITHHCLLVAGEGPLGVGTLFSLPVTCFWLGWASWWVGRREAGAGAEGVLGGISLTSPCGCVTLDSHPDGTGTCFILCDVQLCSPRRHGSVGLFLNVPGRGAVAGFLPMSPFYRCGNEGSEGLPRLPRLPTPRRAPDGQSHPSDLSCPHRCWPQEMGGI